MFINEILVGTVVTIGAINPPKFMQYLIVFTGGGLSVTFLVPVALSIYWHRMNTAGILAAMLGGLCCYLSFYIAGFLIYNSTEPVRLFHLDPLIWGLLASLLFGIIFSKLTINPEQELVNKYFCK